MKKSRRQLLLSGLGVGAGAGAYLAARRAGLIPPSYTAGIFGAGEALTYASQRLLTRHSRAREFDPSQISEKPFVDKLVIKLPEEFDAMRQDGFTGWRVTIDGLVARPQSFSLAELKSFPQSSHITQLICEEGWSYIAQWTGVALSHLLELAGVQPQGRYVVYRSIQPERWDSIDLAEALHPQTLASYAMNGNDLPVPHGGPLRLSVPRQLGYKSVKYLTGLTVTDDLRPFGRTMGTEMGYSWFAGI